MMHDAGGQPVAVIGMIEDITAQVRTQAALQQAHAELEQRVQQRTLELQQAHDALAIFRKFADAAAQGFGMADMEGHITYMNPALCRMAGVAQLADTLGRSLATYYPADYLLRRETEIIPVLLEKGHWEGELTVSPDGTPRTVLQYSFLIRDDAGRPSHLASVITDITQRKTLEDELRQGRDELQAIYEQLIDGIIVVDAATRHPLRANAAFCRMVGCREDEVSAMLPEQVHPAEVLPVVHEHFALLEQGQVAQLQALPFRRPDGSLVYEDVVSRPIVYHGRRGWISFFHDVTASRHAAEALQQSERRFRNSFEPGLIGMAATAPDGRWLQVNDRLCEILGYCREELLATTWLAVTHPDDLSADAEQLRRLLDGQIEHYRLDKRFLRKDGAVVYATIHIRALRRDDGSLDHIVGLMQDITRRKLAEEALRASEERYRNVVEDQTEVICRFRHDGTLTFVNEVYCRFFGKTPPELLGRQWQPLAFPADQPRIEEQLQSLSATHPVVTIENRVYSGQGDLRWMQFANRGFFDLQGRLTEIQAVGRDITARKLAEEALAASEQRLRLAQEVARVGTFESDIATGRTTWTAELETLYGLLPGTFPGTRQAWETLMHGDDLPEVQRRIQYAVDTGEPAEAEWRVVWPDGSVHWLAGRWQVFPDPTGRPHRFVGVNIDISARKRAQEALEREHRTLKHLLQSSDHERQLIAYEIHDGLAQQLAGAIIQFQTFDHQQQKNPGLAAKAYDAERTMLQQGHGEARRLIARVRHPVLDEAGILEAIAHLVNEFRRQPGPKIEFLNSVDFARLVPTLENAIYRIAQEALSNACQHSQSERARISMLQVGDRLRLEVRDWGIGFNPKAVPEDHYGLEGIRQRARLLGGKCRIHSKPGKGTQIIVELPVLGKD